MFSAQSFRKLFVAARPVGLFLCASAALSFAPSFAAETYTLGKKLDGTTGVSFKIGYTLGTHKGSVLEIGGSAQVSNADVDGGSVVVDSAELRVPISSIRTGNALRDCHLTEAMGIDYAASTYPEDGHICDNNQLPTTGPDSVAYPDIILTLKDVSFNGTATDLSGGKQLSATATGDWNIHGQTQSLPLTLTISRAASGAIVAKTQLDFSLAAFDVQVIPWAGIISVKDKATVDIEVEFTKKAISPVRPFFGSVKDVTAPAKGPSPLSWKKVYAKVIQPNCAGCHSPSSPSRVDLTTYAAFKEVYQAVYAFTLFALNPDDERMPPGRGLDQPSKQILANYLVQGLPEFAPTPAPTPAPAL